MNHRKRVTLYKHIVLLSALSWCAPEGLVCAEGNSTARVAPSGEYLDLQRSTDGQIVKNYLPLYQSGKIRYFSAGVGLEERQAEYPPFPLKLIFTAGGKPYLTGVEVKIVTSQGETVASIPKEQMEGPWLFVDLPSGIYDITATKGVRIAAGKQKTLYLRWPEDTGATVNLSNE